MIPIHLDDSDFAQDEEFKQLYAAFLTSRLRLIAYIEDVTRLREAKNKEER